MILVFPDPKRSVLLDYIVNDVAKEYLKAHPWKVEVVREDSFLGYVQYQ